jgi:hypothetical protein
MPPMALRSTVTCPELVTRLSLVSAKIFGNFFLRRDQVIR